MNALTSFSFCVRSPPLLPSACVLLPLEFSLPAIPWYLFTLSSFLSFAASCFTSSHLLQFIYYHRKRDPKNMTFWWISFLTNNRSGRSDDDKVQKRVSQSQEKILNQFQRRKERKTNGLNDMAGGGFWFHNPQVWRDRSIFQFSPLFSCLPRKPIVRWCHF